MAMRSGVDSGATVTALESMAQPVFLRIALHSVCTRFVSQPTVSQALLTVTFAKEGEIAAQRYERDLSRMQRIHHLSSELVCW